MLLCVLYILRFVHQVNVEFESLFLEKSTPYSFELLKGILECVVIFCLTTAGL